MCWRFDDSFLVVDYSFYHAFPLFQSDEAELFELVEAVPDFVSFERSGMDDLVGVGRAFRDVLQHDAVLVPHIC